MFPGRKGRKSGGTAKRQQAGGRAAAQRRVLAWGSLSTSEKGADNGKETEVGRSKQRVTARAKAVLATGNSFISTALYTGPSLGYRAQHDPCWARQKGVVGLVTDTMHEEALYDDGG